MVVGEQTCVNGDLSESGERVTTAPVLNFTRRFVGLSIALILPAISVGHRFNEYGSASLASVIDGPLRGFTSGQDVHAVHLNRWNSIRASQFRDARGQKVIIDCSRLRIQIVLTNEDNGTCLLYTSDAADDLLCVDLGGRR